MAKQDALRAARGHSAHDGVGRGVRAQHAGRHGDDLGLKLHRAGPDVGVQWIRLRAERIGLIEKGNMLWIALVDRARDEPFRPLLIFPRGKFAKIVQYVGPGAARCGQAPVGGLLVAVGMEGGFQLRHQFGILRLNVGVHGRQALQPLLYFRQGRGWKTIEKVKELVHGAEFSLSRDWVQSSLLDGTTGQSRPLSIQTRIEFVVLAIEGAECLVEFFVAGAVG